MRRFLVVTAVAFVLCPCMLSGAGKPSLDGYWWAGMTPSLKLGWVSGYAQAMDLAGTLQMATCASTVPLYHDKYPNVSPKDLYQKMCANSTEFDYDGIAMGQFVDGIDTFFKDYRNKQVEVGLAIQYVRDEIKGKPAQELEVEVVMWRRCSAAMQTGNTDQITKACAPDDTTPKK